MEQWELFSRLCNGRIIAVGTNVTDNATEIHVKTDDGKFLVITGEMHVEEVN